MNIQSNLQIEPNLEKIIIYLPVLHRAAYYEPDSDKYRNIKFEKIDVFDSTSDLSNNLIYLFTVIKIGSITGSLMISAISKDKIGETFKPFEFAQDFWADFFPLLKAKANEELVPFLLESVSKHARKAAVAAVMSRNMSHNIGSHVLARLSEEKKIDSTPAKILLNYLKHRQEFIADISTASAFVTFNRCFYNDVLSRLIPYDNKERTSGDVYTSFTMANSNRLSECYPYLLLEHISGKNDIKEKNIRIKAIKYCNGDYIPTFSSTNNRLVKNDLMISLPNDILGCHAFYIIIENIIRNACKHSKINDNNGGNLEFTFKIEDSNDDYYRISVIDDLGDRNKNTRGKTGFLRDLRYYITDSILKETKLRDGGWGFLEMKICAAYLIRCPLEEIDRFVGDDKPVQFENRIYPSLLQIGFYNNEGQVSDSDYNLGFSFHLLKPKVAQVINNLSEDGIISRLDKDNFKRLGIHTGKPEGFETNGTEHEFLTLLDNKHNNKKIENITNQRVVSITKDDIWCITYNIDEVRKYLYSIYIQSPIEPLFAIDGKLPFQQNEITINSILFDNHGEWGLKNNSRIDKTSYYEPYSSQSLTKTLFVDTYNENAMDPIKKEIMRYEINEAARTKIILLDERIQSAALEQTVLRLNGNNEIKRIQVLNWTKVYTPNLDESNLGINNVDIKSAYKFINDKLYIEDVEYLVVHLGIIEKLAGSTDKEVINDWICKHKDRYGNDWLSPENKTKQFKIVVISGRGLPSNLPIGVLYVPISLIYQYTISYPSKTMLTKLLKSIRIYRKR